MLTTQLALAEKYDFCSERFQKAYAFLRREDLASLAPGKYPIDGETVFASVQEYDTAPASTLRCESHEKYFDIQYMVAGEEMFAYGPSEMLQADSAYDAENDIVFFKEPAAKQVANVLLTPGEFVIVAAEDAHKPRCAVENPVLAKKIVIKVLV